VELRSVAIGGGEDGASYVLSGDAACCLQLWNARDGKPLGRLAKNEPYMPLSIAMGVVKGQTVAISTYIDRSSWWDPSETRGVRFSKMPHDRRTGAHAFGQLDGFSIPMRPDQTKRYECLSRPLEEFDELIRLEWSNGGYPRRR
jgi:hypothetical protein